NRVGRDRLLREIEVELIQPPQVPYRFGDGPGFVGVDADLPLRSDRPPDETQSLHLPLDIAARFDVEDLERGLHAPPALLLQDRQVTGRQIPEVADTGA